VVLGSGSGDNINMKITVLVSALFLTLSVDAAARGCSGPECLQSRNITLKSSAYDQALNGAFQSRTCQPGMPCGSGPAQVSGKKRSVAADVVGTDVTKKSSLGEEPPSPFAAAAKAAAGAVSGGCATGQCPFKGKSASGAANAAAQQAGSACASCGRKGMDIVRAAVRFFSFGLLG